MPAEKRHAFFEFKRHNFFTHTLWRYFVWMINTLALTFAPDLVPDVKSGLKGKPVRFRRYPRSCKLCKLFVLQATVLKLTGRQQTGSKPEDLPGSSTIIQSFRVKGMECKSCKAFIFLSFNQFLGSSHKKKSFQT